MHLAHFLLDFLPDERLEAYTLGETWNGWGCPYFTLDQAHRLVEVWQSHGFLAAYDHATEAFAFGPIDLEDGSDPALVPLSSDAVEWYVAEVVEGRQYFPIGARGWIWDEVVA